MLARVPLISEPHCELLTPAAVLTAIGLPSLIKAVLSATMLWACTNHLGPCGAKVMAALARETLRVSRVQSGCNLLSGFAPR
jgi:hypothetical protein